jgi:hypothetical protein
MIVRKSKNRYEQSLADKLSKNPKSFWKVVKDAQRQQNKLPPLKRPLEGTLSENATEAAEILSKTFSNIFTVDDQTVPEFHPDRQIGMDHMDISEEILRLNIVRLKAGRACGDDGISNDIIKSCSESMILPLTRIIGRSFETGQVPVEWRSATVCPIFKKGDKSDPSNYRPVSLTSSISKLAERCFLDNLVPMLENSGVLQSSQYGFRQGRSCQEQLLYCLKKISDQLRYPPHCSNVLYFDFAKAFDSVPHQKLLYKLARLGVTGSALKWVEGFLSNRRQRVRVDSEHSRWVQVTSGVPQGSVCGPILFLIYISDIDKGLPDDVGRALFADDLKIFHPWPEVLQRSAEHICNWSAKWQLPLNNNKLELLSFGTRTLASEVEVGGERVPEAVNVRDLGVVMDRQLNFRDHIRKTTTEAHRRANFLLRRFRHLDKTSLTYLFNTTVRTVIEYCSTVWSPSSKALSAEVEAVQRRFTKRIPGYKNMDYPQRLKALDLLSLEDRRAQLDLILTHKIVSGRSCLPFSLLFESVPQRTQTLRGHSKRLATPPHSRHGRDRGFFWNRVIKPWNSLPEEVVSADLEDFKKHFPVKKI